MLKICFRSLKTVRYKPVRSTANQQDFFLFFLLSAIEKVTSLHTFSPSGKHCNPDSCVYIQTMKSSRHLDRAQYFFLLHIYCTRRLILRDPVFTLTVTLLDPRPRVKAEERFKKYLQISVRLFSLRGSWSHQRCGIWPEYTVKRSVLLNLPRCWMLLQGLTGI